MQMDVYVVSLPAASDLTGLKVDPRTNVFPDFPVSSKEATNSSNTSAVSLASACKQVSQILCVSFTIVCVWRHCGCCV